MTSGPPAHYADLAGPFRDGEADEYTTNIEYDHHPGKSNLGPVHSRFEDTIKLSHPAPDIEALKQATHIEAQLHRYNRNHKGGEWPYPNNGRILYDLAILDVMGEFLDVEQLSPENLDIPMGRFKTIFLKKARDPVPLTEFFEYLSNSKPVLVELGYKDASEMPGYETLRLSANEKLPRELTDTEQTALEAAVTRSVYAVYRNGIDVPPAVNKKYGFSAVAPPLYEKKVRRTIKQKALRNWVRLFFDETLQPLTFHRVKPENNFEQYIGLFAGSARSDCGVQTVPDVLDYDYSRDRIPKGSGIGKYIKNRLPLNSAQAVYEDTEIPPITEQFDAVHSDTLQLADRRGFFSKPRSVAVDLYRIEWSGDENDVTINRPGKSENDIRSEWTYAIFGIIDNEARFTFGTRWLPDKSKYPDALSELRPMAGDLVDIKALYADKEILSGALIREFRNIAGSDWVARAPNRSKIKSLKKFTPTNHIGYVPTVTWNISPKPAAVAYPYESSGPSLIEFKPWELKLDTTVETTEQALLFDLADGESGSSLPPTLREYFDEPKSQPGIGSDSTHAAYITDRSVPEHSAASIHFPYYQRWAVEESINQISNDFMPTINSNSEKLRLYGVNVAILFQNWHTLINRAPSPKLKLRLNVTHTELLKVIEDVAFADTT